MKFITAFLCFIFPTQLIFWLLNLIGHRVSSKARIGFSVVFCERMHLDDGARVGHFNYLRLSTLTAGKKALIGNFNKVTGPVDLHLADKGALGNNNRVYRAAAGVTYGKAVLKIGILSKITGGHRLDCTRSVIIGDYSILAGHGSQLWTHAYYHDPSGPGRFRVDGEINIGNNVYVGTMCVITADVSIADGVVIGANACVSKSLTQPGTYVSQPLRNLGHMRRERSDFRQVNAEGLCEEVMERRKGEGE